MGHDYCYEYEVTYTFERDRLVFCVVEKTSVKHDTFDSGFGDPSSHTVEKGEYKLNVPRAPTSKPVPITRTIARSTKFSDDHYSGTRTYDVLLEGDEDVVHIAQRDAGAPKPANAIVSVEVPQFE